MDVFVMKFICSIFISMCVASLSQDACDLEHSVMLQVKKTSFEQPSLQPVAAGHYCEHFEYVGKGGPNGGACYEAASNANQCTHALSTYGLVSVHLISGQCFCCTGRTYATPSDPNWITYYASNDAQDLQEDNANLQAENENLSEQNDNLQGQYADVSEQNDDLQGQIDDLTEQNGNLQGQKDDLAEQNGNLQGQVDDLTEHNDNLQGQIDDLTEQNDNLQGQSCGWQVKAAGLNNYGNLGVTQNSGTNYRNPIPLLVTALGTEAVAASAGSSHTVWLMKDGSVKAAGYNKYGQLGVSENFQTENPNPTPLLVSALGTDVAAISAGHIHTMFLMKDGSVQGVGSNYYGELGVPATSSSNPTPLLVTALGTDVAAISAGGFHTVFLMKDGSVRAVGRNKYGGLGVTENSGTDNPNPTPLFVTALSTDVAAISAGYYQTLFLMNDGSVKASGRNRYGNLGVTENSDTNNPNPTPMLVTALGTDVAAISSGYHTNMWLMKDGSVKAAGRNLYGELGVSRSSGSYNPTSTPVLVSALGTDVAAVSATNSFTMFLMKDGSVKAAGSNFYGNLGVTENYGTDRPNPTPLLVTALGTDVAAVTAGWYHTTFLLKAS
eukprot:TRINITY_DN9327_c0_g3_i1.p1 TRINITY_DN9327_c0_g3~~TRINITY_DN9327_c0_g3_i1.p1  ORF type:complete len:609 (-),score=96.23 TRINITY_DN9327_c0_g3_i1:56-1882(-)